MTIEEEAPALSPRERTILSTILLAIAILISIDVVSDMQDGAGIAHTVVEVIVGVSALIGYGLLMKKSMATSSALEIAQERLHRSREEANYWKENSRVFIEGLSQAIDEQLHKWKFTSSEKEVALLMLKGLSSREIAEIRGVSDKTVRAQAASIYEKSGLAGRAELSAFFLEDLLAPKQEPK